MGQKNKNSVSTDDIRYRQEEEFLKAKKERYKQGLKLESKKLAIQTLDSNRSFLEGYARIESWQQFALVQLTKLQQKHISRQTGDYASNQKNMIELRGKIFEQMIEYVHAQKESSLKWEDTIFLQNLVAKNTILDKKAGQRTGDSRMSVDSNSFKMSVGSPRLTICIKGGGFFDGSHILSNDRKRLEQQQDKIISKAVLKSLIFGMEVEDYGSKGLIQSSRSKLSSSRSTFSPLQHPLLKFITEFSSVICLVYRQSVDYVVATKKYKRAFELIRLFNSDIQDFLFITLQILRFFYRRCITIENKIFCDDAVEGITNRLFESNNGKVFDLMLAILKIQEIAPVACLEERMGEFNNITLQELNVDLQIEKLKLGFSYRHERMVPQHSMLEDDSPTGNLDTSAGREETYNLFQKIIKKVKRLSIDHKDPRLIMIQLLKIHEAISKQYLIYKWINNTEKYRQQLKELISSNCEITQDLIDKIVESSSSQIPIEIAQTYVSLDTMLPCLIYVIIKAQLKELPALLPLIKLYTLDKRHQEFELMSINLEATTEFVQTQLDTIRGKQLRYTYSAGGRSQFIENYNPVAILQDDHDSSFNSVDDLPERIATESILKRVKSISKDQSMRSDRSVLQKATDDGKRASGLYDGLIDQLKL